MFLFYSWIRGLLTVANLGCPPPLISSKWLEIMGEHLPSIDCADWEREKRREQRGGWRRSRRAVNAIVCGAVVDTGPGSICPCYRDRDWSQKKIVNWTCAAMACLYMSYTWVEALCGRRPLCGHTGCTCPGPGLGPAASRVRHIPVRMTTGWRQWLWYLRMALKAQNP
jgi:hypothetical protein